MLMQKRAELIAFVVLGLLLPGIAADISLEGPGKRVMNIGDEPTISGYILQHQDMIALFKIVLKCSTEQQLLVKSVSLKADVQKAYSETIPIPLYLDGTCTLDARLESGGKVIDQTSSPPFTLSRDLIGTFSLDKDQLKLGDSVTLTGSLTKLDGAPVTGIATLYFKQNGVDVAVDTKQVGNGKLSYTYTPTEQPAGEYTIHVAAQDFFGNMKTFDAGSFSLAGDVAIFAAPNKLHYSPGEKVKISGEAKILDVPMKKAHLTITLADVVVKDDFSDGRFSDVITLPVGITSGTQIITLAIEDDFGNRGMSTLSLIVDPAAKRLELRKEKENYLPGEVVKFTPVLTDQAGDVIAADIGIIVKNPKGKEVYTDSISSNSDMEFQLLSSALPGTWTVHLFALNQETDGTFLVGEQVLLEYALFNQTLYITNKGNVKFSSPLKVEYKSLERSFTLVKEFSIGSNETIALNLASDVESGVYDIYIADKVFKDIPLIHEGGSGRGILLAVLILITLFLLVLLALYINGWRKHAARQRHPRRRESRERIIAAHHPHDEKEHVIRFKQKMATHAESNKPPLKLKIRRRKEPDDFIFELPQKKEAKEAEQPSSGHQHSGWNEPVSRYEFPQQRPAEEREEEHAEAKKKGLFNMFE